MRIDVDVNGDERELRRLIAPLDGQSAQANGPDAGPEPEAEPERGPGSGGGEGR
ncbi:hypothetical protein [Streptomyces sp. NPDC048636]|uniref:hypothetical protein n=1 Tax=Streptomyces sp. NPDC048636 TaxID=3155762 RepID=UPI00342F42EB